MRLNVLSLEPSDVFMVSEGRQEFLNRHKPVSTYFAVKGLARPEFLVEMDAIAFGRRRRFFPRRIRCMLAVLIGRE